MSPNFFFIIGLVWEPLTNGCNLCFVGHAALVSLKESANEAHRYLRCWYVDVEHVYISCFLCSAFVAVFLTYRRATWKRESFLYTLPCYLTVECYNYKWLYLWDCDHWTLFQISWRYMENYLIDMSLYEKKNKKKYVGLDDSLANKKNLVNLKISKMVLIFCCYIFDIIWYHDM